METTSSKLKKRKTPKECQADAGQNITTSLESKKRRRSPQVDSSRQKVTSVSKKRKISKTVDSIRQNVNTTDSKRRITSNQSVPGRKISRTSNAKKRTISNRADSKPQKVTKSKPKKRTISNQAHPKPEKPTTLKAKKSTISNLAEPKRQQVTTSEPMKRTTSNQTNLKQQNSTTPRPKKRTTSNQAESIRQKTMTSKQMKRTTSSQADTRRQKATRTKPKKRTTSNQADPIRQKTTTSKPKKLTTSNQADPKRQDITTSESKEHTRSNQAYSKRQEVSTSESKERTTFNQADPRRLKIAKCLEFSVKRPEELTIDVTAVLCVSNAVVVVDDYNKVLKLFDQNGIYLSSTKYTDSTWGLTNVHENTFATCSDRNTVYLWKVREQSITSEDVEYQVNCSSSSIHYNGTFYCLLHRCDSTITILDRKLVHVRAIVMKEAFGKTFEFVYTVHMDSETNNIFVLCREEHGVLCITIEGHALWFTPLSGLPLGITEIHGTLCITDYYNACISLITKEGEYVRKLLDKEDLGGMPRCVCYGQDDKLYVSYNPFFAKGDMISVYTATYIYHDV